MSTSLAVCTEGLGKRYGATWALRDCTLEIPTGSVAALVGPNGAGKTTLLHLAIGLSRQTCGTVEVLGLSPRDDGKALLPRLGFVAQDHPLYRGLTIAETFKLARKLNPHWDDRFAAQRVGRPGAQARPQGRQALRRPAGAGGADACARQAARAPDLGRAGRLPRSARSARVPQRRHGGGCRDRDDRRSSPRTSFPSWSVSATTSSRSRTAERSSPGRSPRSSPAIACSLARGATARAWPESTTSSGKATPSGRRRCSCAQTDMCMTRSGSSTRSTSKRSSSPTSGTGRARPAT